MLLSVSLVAAIAFSIATVLLILFGHRTERMSWAGSTALALATALAAGEITARLWQPATLDALVGQAVVVVAVAVTTLAARHWNPFGHLFLGTYSVTALSYLAFALQLTIAGELGPLGIVASTVLLVLEAAALLLTWLFSFEACDVVCRVQWPREPRYDPSHLPFVSVHVAAYSEPPEMLIKTIKSLEALNYPRYEIVVIDNNTDDPSIWEPVRDYCRDRELVRFDHVDPWPGHKAGALNLALTGGHTSDEAELIAVVDADYRVDEDWLSDLVGYFVDPDLAFVQPPQDYRDWRGDTYLTACYDALDYFFAISLRSRNQRGGAMFSGTMGLLRRSALEEVGGWNEWCITEDAEVSIRLLKAGYTGHFVDQPYGRGIMPLDFGALKRQRFRWAFGGMQTLRLHWRSLLPWDRDPDNRMSVAQRLHHLAGNSGWFIDPVIFWFSAVLFAIAASILIFGDFEFRPLYGAAVVLPVALLVNGLMRGVWALVHGSGIPIRRALLAFANFLSLSWTVTLACAKGLTSDESTFLRTPKWEGESQLRDAFRQARTETALAAGLWGAGAVAASAGGVGWFLGLIFLWQGTVYAAAPLTSYLAVEADLTPELEIRRRWNELRQALYARSPALASMSVMVLAAGVAALLTITGPDASEQSRRLLDVPRRGPDAGLIGQFLKGRDGDATPDAEPSPTETTDDAAPAPTSSPEPQRSPEPPPAQQSPAPQPADPAPQPTQQATEPAPQPTNPGQQPTRSDAQPTDPGQQPTDAGATRQPTDPGAGAGGP